MVYPVPGEGRVDQEVRGVQHRGLQMHALGQVEGVERLLVGVDDSADARVGPPDGHPTACPCLAKKPKTSAWSPGAMQIQPAAWWSAECGGPRSAP